MAPKIDDIPQLLIDTLPKRVVQIRRIIEENTADSGELLYYPIVSQILDAVVDDERKGGFSDRTELQRLSALAESALASDDDRLSNLFILEFLEALALGPFAEVPVRDILGTRGKAHYDSIVATRKRASFPPTGTSRS
jgi:hypothetical protein